MVAEALLGADGRAMVRAGWAGQIARWGGLGREALHFVSYKLPVVASLAVLPSGSFACAWGRGEA